MRFPKRARNEAAFLALFDIQATSVGVCIARYSNGTTSVLWHNRIDYSYKVDADYEHYERSMYAALLEAGMMLTSTGVKSVRDNWPDLNPAHMKSVCILAPPWFFGTVVTVQKEWDIPTPVTDRVAETLHKEAVELAGKVPEAASWQTVVGEALLLEHRPQQATLNGYPTTSFKGEKVMQASVSDYAAYIGKDVCGHVREILERVLPNHDVGLLSSTTVLADMYSAVMGRGASHQGYLIEVGGHVTSIATIRNTMLAAVSTIPFGTHDLFSAVMPEATSAEEARSKLLMIMKQAERTADGDLVIPKALEGPVAEWHAAVCNTFRVQGKGTVPYELIYLVSPGRWTSLFTAVLKRPWVMPCIRTEQVQKVTPISVMVEGPVSATKKTQSQQSEGRGDIRMKVFSHALFYNMRV